MTLRREARYRAPLSLASEIPRHVGTIASRERTAARFIGRRLAGRYTIHALLGRGGLADVFVARDEHLRRDVAVKILRPDMASEEWCARMMQEALGAATIDHPHALRVTDVGRVDETAFLVMDLLRGASLEDTLRDLPAQRMPWRRAITLLLPAMDALQAAHDHGLVHRDIKPANLFLHAANGGEKLIVVDFGIAKTPPALRDEAGLAATLTGQILGTPAFMSPEQACGLPIDHRSDIYAIGVTLYRCLTGRLPFVLSRDLPVQSLLAKHVHAAPPPLTAVDLSLPLPVQEAVLRAMAKDPAARHPSMHAFADTLQACLLGPDPSPIPALDPPAATKPILGPLPSTAALLATALVGLTPGQPPLPEAQHLPARPELHDPVVPLAIVVPPRPAAPPPIAVPLPRRPLPRVAPSIVAATVRDCLTQYGDPDRTQDVDVEVTADSAGVIQRALLLDGDDTLVAPCIARRLPGLPGGFRSATRRQRFRMNR